MENKIKEELVEWILKPENEDLLQTLVLIKETSTSDDWLDDLTDSEKKSIKKGIEDHKRGKILTSKDFWKKHA